MADHIQWLPVLGGGKCLHGTVYSDHVKRRVPACAPNQEMVFLAPELVPARGALPNCKRCEKVFAAYPEMLGEE